LEAGLSYIARSPYQKNWLIEQNLLRLERKM
jgi:hypothetical protein